MKAAVLAIAYNAAGEETGRYCNEDDLVTLQWALFVGANVFATNETIKDTGGTNRSVTSNTATVGMAVLAGTGTTAAQVTDYQIQTAVSGSSGSITGTLSAIVQGPTATGTATILATLSNTSGGTVAYSELGLVVAAGGHSFLITHDVFAGISVAQNGTLALTYVLQNS